MMTRQLSLLLSGFALLVALALPSGTAHAATSDKTHAFVSSQEGAPLWQYAGDKKKPKPTPGPQDGDD